MPVVSAVAWPGARLGARFGSRHFAIYYLVSCKLPTVLAFLDNEGPKKGGRSQQPI